MEEKVVAVEINSSDKVEKKINEALKGGFQVNYGECVGNLYLVYLKKCTCGKKRCKCGCRY